MRTIALASRACVSLVGLFTMVLVLIIPASSWGDHLTLGMKHRLPRCRALAPCRHPGCALCGPYLGLPRCDLDCPVEPVQGTVLVPETQARDAIVWREVPIIAPVTEVYEENVYHTDVELVHDPLVESYHRMELQPHTTMVPVATHRAARGVIVWYPCSVKKLVPVDYGHYEEIECDPDDVCCGEPYFGQPDYQGYASVTSGSGCGGGAGCGSSGGGQPGTTIITWHDGPGGSGCADCAGADCQKPVSPCHQRMRRVWVPDVRMVEMCVTEMKYHVVERPCETITDVCPVTTFTAVPVTDQVVHHRVRPRITTHRIPVTHTVTKNRLTFQQVPMVERHYYKEWVPKYGDDRVTRAGDR